MEERILEGKTIHYYHLQSMIGRGSSACVYLARDLRSDRLVACKLVEWEHAWGVSALNQEWDILSMLDHPGIPRPLEILDTAYGRMLVMTHIQGIRPEKLKPEDWVEGWNWLPSRMRCVAWELCVMEWSLQVCHILRYLHERPDPLIYGDLKPSNLVINEQGEISLVDLGTACFLSQSEERKKEGILFGGTPGYAAPEQYAAEPGFPIPGTDIYALGVLMEKWISMVWGLPVSGPVKRIIGDCASLSIADRPQSVREVIYRLQTWIAVRRGETALYRMGGSLLAIKNQL